jgi:NAD(P)H-hydrate epimerase
VWQIAAPKTAAAQAAYTFAVQAGVTIKPFSVAAFQASITGMLQGVLVDALLGTGAQLPLRDSYQLAVNALNASAWPIMALDIPSGVCADTGNVKGLAINATLTISFIGQKLGNVIGQGRVASGQRQLDDLGVPVTIFTEAPAASCLNLSVLLESLPQRSLDAHKGDSGHVMIVGGDEGYGGAPLMAAQMAARAGAGLVGVATRPTNTAAIIARQPEIMAAGVVSGQTLLPFLERPTVLVIGPGLGQSAWSEQLFYHCIHADKPMVIDADALNIMAQGRIALPCQDAIHKRPWLLTPHPGEASRLLNCSIAEIQADRVAAIYALQQRYGGVVVLKGAGSLVLTSQQQLFVCDAGNPAMASGGMGDLLSGLLAALLAQGLSIDLAACLGVALHARSADIAVLDQGARGLLATDLMHYVRLLMNGRQV